MIAAGNRIDHFAYSYGGGHGDPAQTMNQSNPNPAAVPGAEENGGPGYDCWSATSYVLWGGGLGQSLLGGGVLVSGDLESVGLPGPGRWVTIFATAGHAYIEVAGIYLDTAAGLGNPPNPPATGPRWSTVGPPRAGSSSAIRRGSEAKRRSSSWFRARGSTGRRRSRAGAIHGPRRRRGQRDLPGQRFVVAVWVELAPQFCQHAAQRLVHLEKLLACRTERRLMPRSPVSRWIAGFSSDSVRPCREQHWAPCSR